MKLQIKTVAAAVALACAAGSANAVLERTGPLNHWGFPTWYQDTTGIALEYCNPLNQAELDGGHCLLLPGDVTLPEPDVGPGYFDEHFWWAGEALMTTANGGRALLVLAAEAAFGADPTPGGQIAFTRIRVRLDNVPVTGEYRFIHPYGEEVGFAQAGERIFITDDVGIACPPGDFECATQGRLGPFLLASNEPGGAELPPVAGGAPGKLYIADPGRSGPVTGSPTGNNLFRIEGPAGSNLDGQGNDFIQTTDFSLMGRLFSGVMPGKISELRANYADQTVAGKKVDVFLKAEPTGQSRVPGSPRPPAVLPVTSFFDQPCDPVFAADGTTVASYRPPTGSVEKLMKANGEHRWGQVRGTLPNSVCVKDNTGIDLAGNTVPTFTNVLVRDEVKIGAAYYDPNAKTLSVEATSSDEVNPPTLTLEGFGPLTAGVVTVPDVSAPPASVLVSSSKHGSASLRVNTNYDESTGGGGAPLAENDLVSTAEDVAVDIDVLSNDTVATGTTVVSVVSQPGFGTATVNAANQVHYTPNANANGSDVFSYMVAVDGVASNVATVSVTVNATNDVPVANNDGPITGAIGVPLTLFPLANDSDVDGDVLTLANVSAVTPAGATLDQNANGSLTFNASAAGTYTFTYEASDGQLSAPATVTVSVAAPETIALTSAEFRSGKNRWRAGGTSSIEGDHEVKILLTGAGCTQEGRLIGTTTSVAGVYALDTTGSAPGAGCTQVRAESVLGGISQPFGIRIRN